MTETNRWIPVKVRPLTDEEKKLYEEYEFMYDCKLPDDCQQDSQSALAHQSQFP